MRIEEAFLLEGVGEGPFAGRGLAARPAPTRLGLRGVFLLEGVSEGLFAGRDPLPQVCELLNNLWERVSAREEAASHDQWLVDCPRSSPEVCFMSSPRICLTSSADTVEP